MVLPTQISEMEAFIKENRKDVFNHVVENIHHAVRYGWDAVEVFAFASTNFLIVIAFDDFKDNLWLAMEHALLTNDHELRGKVKKVMELLDGMTFAINYKIQPKDTNVQAEKATPKAPKGKRDGKHRRKAG